MSNKVGLTLKSKFDNGRSVSGGGAVFHTERLRKEDRLNLKTAPNTITLYRHGLEEVDKKDQKAVYGYFHNLENSIKQDYQKHSHRNRKWQDKNELFYEGIIAFGRDKFEKVNNPQQIMEYCTNYCNLLEEKTGAKIHMVSLHLDEGHLNEEGQLQHNYHAHFLLVNYNETTHKSALRNAKILADEYRTEIKTYTTKSGETKQKTVKTKEPTGNQIEVLYDFKQIQNDLGKHFAPLGFERGRDYAAEGLKCPKNIDHKSYTEIKVAEQQQINQLMKDVQKEIEPILNFAEEQKLEVNSAQEFVDSLKTQILDKKDQLINDFREQLTKQTLELKELKELYDKTRKELIESKEAKQPDYQALKQDYEAAKRKLESTIMGEISQAKQKGFNVYEKRLEAENNTSIIKRNLLKKIEKPTAKVFLDNQLSDETRLAVTELLEIKQKIEEKPVIKEVIVHREKVIEVPKYVDKIIEKTIEKPVIVDIDENQRLRSQLQLKAMENIKLTSEIHALKSEVSYKESQRQQAENYLARERKQNEEQKEVSDKFYNQIKDQRGTINSLRQENSTLKTENKALLSAIERFLDLGIVKSTLEGAKTFLERFNEAVDNLKDLLIKKVEPQKEIEPEEPTQSYGMRR
jgi:hypothetical protein